MSRAIKGIRDMVKETRIQSEVRVSSSSSNNNLTSQLTANPKMAKINSNVYQASNQGSSNSVTNTGTQLKSKTNNVMIGGDFSLQQNGINDFTKDMDNVNKLSSATAKLFANNNGGGDENFLPEIKDRSIGLEMRKIIEEQRKELEHRNATVQALQRNFESLSTLCLNERAEKANLQKINDQVKQENKEYAQQLITQTNQIEQLSRDLEAIQKEKKKFDKLREDYTNIKTQLDSAKQQIEVKNGKIEKLESDLSSLRQKIQDLNIKYLNFDEQLKEQDKLKDELRQKLKESQKQVEGLNLEVKKYQIQVADKDYTITSLKQELEDQKVKYNDLNDKFNKKLNLLKEFEQDLERERQNKREIEKQLKDFRNAAESQQALLKTGQMSQDELRTKVNEQAKALQLLEIDLERQKEENLRLSKELQEQKDLFKKGTGGLQKDLISKNEQIQILENKVKSQQQDILMLQKAISDQEQQQNQLELKNDELLHILSQKSDEIQKLLKTLENLKQEKDNEKNSSREEYMRVITQQKEELIQIRQSLKTKEGENLELSRKLKDLEQHILKISEQNQDASSLQKRFQEQIDKLSGENSDLQSKIEQLQKENLDFRNALDQYTNKSSSSDDQLQLLKSQLDKEISNFNSLKNQKSEQNSKMEQLIKDKRQLEAEIASLKQEKKDLSKEKSDIEKKQAHTYERLEDAMKKIAQLEKDIELQEEVLKKRHAEINSLLKENTGYKNQLDEIRRNFGDLEQIETRIKIATLKEEKINNLLGKLDHVMASTENNLSCYSCMGLLQDPIIVVPCGHTFCKKCLLQKDSCLECEKKIKASVPSKIIADLVNKYEFNKDAIQTFRNESVWKNALDSK